MRTRPTSDGRRKAHRSVPSSNAQLDEVLALVGQMISEERPWDPVVVTDLSDRARDLRRSLEAVSLARLRQVNAQAAGDHGAHLIVEERGRQLVDEGYHPAGDDSYVDGQLASAAWCYLSAAIDRIPEQPEEWPWDAQWWKPTFGIRDLVRAGALIAAELTRRKRAHDAFLALVVEACVAGGAERDYAAAEVDQVVPDFLEEERIEVGHPDRDWGVSGAAALADELVLHHLEGRADG
jgi:hypothetical protein